MRVSCILAALAAAAVEAATTNDVAFQASLDGTEQRYVEVVPDSDGPSDALIVLHGYGADRWQFVRESRGECRAAREVAAARGMILVSPDYRASGSWMGPAAEADLLQIIGNLKQKRGAGRIFLAGASMGATGALTFTARHPGLVAGVVALNGLADHLSYTNFQQAIEASFGCAKAVRPEAWKERSALYYPERFTMPLALTLGGSDTVVPPDSARAFARAVAALQPEVYVDDKPGRRHETDYADSLAAFRAMFRWADAVTVTLGGREVEPAPATAAGVWFYARGNAQLLLLGHEGMPGWRAVAEGGDWKLNGRPVATGMLAGPFAPKRRAYSRGPVPCSPDLAPALAGALVDWDWRMSDGIGTPREAKSFAEVLPALRARFAAMKLGSAPAASGDEAEWLALHRAIRAACLAKLPRTPLLFLKHVPSAMSHQLTQMYGYCSRPGGGIFLLEEPGVSMRTRDITPAGLPAGNFMTPELSFDASKMLFAYSPVRVAPPGWRYNAETAKLRYHIYEMPLAGGEARQLTRGDVDAFFPIYLPGGDILFSSTLRGGYHRCGQGPCFVYTLSRMGGDGSNPHSISFHETHEWNPALLPDGRVIYSRWDYVDRNGVLYQQLWTARPDGGGVRIYYGNNTWNPCGTWECRPVPGSHKIMAIGGPHHGMSAGAVILVDNQLGVDGLEPITRLTPGTRFPESEEPMPWGPDIAKPFDFDTPRRGYWHGGILDPRRNRVPPEEELRWPGHCYKTPWPLREKVWLASYSFDQLVGEPGGNLPNLFGIYLCDAFGNRELLYRDPAISSVWARPVAKRPVPPEIRSVIDPAYAEKGKGTFFLSNVTDSWPYAFPTNRPIRALRIFEVIKKTTPNIDSPKVAAGMGALGRWVLGTVPVDADGSAFFEAPAKTPIYFQALDGEGRAVQTMRSLVYLQPGERESCVGCHESRSKPAEPRPQALALKRAPSVIAPGPDGSRPFSYPRLVQPILDANCVKCHDGTKPKCPSLTGGAEGWASRSFNVLIRHVAYSGWGLPEDNHEPITEPLRFGALASPLLKRLDSGHGGVRLSPSERDRMILWMDSNGAFYGTFDPELQRKQLNGERIEAREE